MTAVFCISTIYIYIYIYNDFCFTPKNKFVRIRSISDVTGRKFDSVITFGAWYKCKEASCAYEYLKRINPEIF